MYLGIRGVSLENPPPRCYQKARNKGGFSIKGGGINQRDSFDGCLTRIGTAVADPTHSSAPERLSTMIVLFSMCTVRIAFNHTAPGSRWGESDHRTGTKDSLEILTGFCRDPHAILKGSFRDSERIPDRMLKGFSRDSGSILKGFLKGAQGILKGIIFKGFIKTIDRILEEFLKDCTRILEGVSKDS